MVPYLGWIAPLLIGLVLTPITYVWAVAYLNQVRLLIEGETLTVRWGPLPSRRSIRVPLSDVVRFEPRDGGVRLQLKGRAPETLNFRLSTLGVSSFDDEANHVAYLLNRAVAERRAPHPQLPERPLPNGHLPEGPSPQGQLPEAPWRGGKSD